MARALVGIEPAEFAQPEEGVAISKIDKATGIPATTPEAIDEFFLAGTEPTDATRTLDSPFLVDDEEGPGAVAKP